MLVFTITASPLPIPLWYRQNADAEVVVVPCCGSLWVWALQVWVLQMLSVAADAVLAGAVGMGRTGMAVVAVDMT